VRNPVTERKAAQYEIPVLPTVRWLLYRFRHLFPYRGKRFRILEYSGPRLILRSVGRARKYQAAE
jgi:hypothetical protein